MSKIIIDPAICNGLPAVAGARITARTVLDLLSAGDSTEDVLDAYPLLTQGDVLKCLAYSTDVGRPDHQL